MAASHPSLRWQPAFPRQSALLSDVTPRRAAERKKPSSRTRRGVKPDGGGCFVPCVMAPAAGAWPRCSVPRRAGLGAYSGHQPFPESSLQSDLPPGLNQPGSPWRRTDLQVSDTNTRSRGPGKMLPRGRTGLFRGTTEPAINTSSEHHSPSSLMFCCYLLQAHFCCCYFYLLFFPLCFFGCLRAALQKRLKRKMERRSGTLGRRLGMPGGQRPRGQQAPRLRALPVTHHGQQFCPRIPPARGTADPRAGRSSAPGIILTPGFPTFSLVHPMGFLLHFHPTFGQPLSSAEMNRSRLDVARYRALPAHGAIPESVAGHEAAGPRRTNVVGHQKCPPLQGRG